MSNPLNPQNGRYEGYPYGFVVGMKGSSSEFVTGGRRPKDEGVPVPGLDKVYQADWSNAFSIGWYEGYNHAKQNGAYSTPITVASAYDFGVLAGYPYGAAEGTHRFGITLTEGKNPTVVGREPPLGWTDAQQASWSNGFSDGWLAGFTSTSASAPAWPDPSADPSADSSWQPPKYKLGSNKPSFTYSPQGFLPVFHDDQNDTTVWPGPDDAGIPGAGSTDPGSGTDDAGTDTGSADTGADNSDGGGDGDTKSSSTPWILGGLALLGALGVGYWVTRDKWKSNPIDQRDYNFYVVVNGKIESGWEYREDAQEQIAENLPPIGAKVLTRKTLLSRGIDPHSDANWIKGAL